MTRHFKLAPFSTRGNLKKNKDLGIHIIQDNQKYNLNQTQIWGMYIGITQQTIQENKVERPHYLLNKHHRTLKVVIIWKHS